METFASLPAHGKSQPSDLAQILGLAADKTPDTVIRILCDHEEPVEISYSQLLARASSGAAALGALGARPGDKVALLLDNTADFLVALWSAIYAGLVPVALTAVRNDPERWTRYLDHVDDLFNHPLFVADQAYAQDLATYKSINVYALEQSEKTSPHHSSPDDPALIVLTSGSTGNAKAVVLSHANLLASLPAKAKMHELVASDTSLNWISFDHVAALIETHLLPLFVGAAQVHVGAASILADPLLFLRLIERHGITMTFTPNFLLAQINAALQDAKADSKRYDLSKLRHIISGGEAVRVHTGKVFLDLLQSHGLSCKALWPAFGMTETCAGSVYSREFPKLDGDYDFAALGLPIEGVSLRIADEHDHESRDGEPGELQLKGPAIFKGYHNNPEATMAAFTADGWFRSGDLGVLEQGRLRLLGRSKDSIIVSGVNYFSHELEAVLEQLDRVEKSFVAAFATRLKGTDTEQLVITFAHNEDDAGLFRLIIAIRSATILLWGFRPRAILPLDKADFPKTSLGKIQRASLRRTYENGGFHKAESRVADMTNLGGFVPAVTEPEVRISQIYGHIFQMEPTTISTSASFFDLGGTSIDILKLKRLVEEAFDLDDLPVLTVLQYPTIQALATHLGQDDRPYDPIVTLQSTGDKTPLFVVHPGVGEVLVFVHLAQYFVGERPFHALRARGFNKGETHFTQFSEMVQSYVDAIRQRQPHGPFALAGYSYGGAVAFEIAKTLEAEGERVDFIGIFNLPPNIKYRMVELDLVEGAVNLAFFLSLIDKKQSQELPAWLRARPDINHNEWLVNQAPPERLAELDIDLAKFTAWADLAQSLLTMGRSYEPSGRVESLSVFYAIPLRGTKDDWLANELRRWDDFSRSANRYIEVAGEHYTLMSLKHVASFQAKLRTELDRALEGK